jgi:Glycosyltransferase Family 4
MDYPRLAIISVAVPETHFAGSLLMYRLLHDYPANRLIVMGPAPHPDSEVLSAQYHSIPEGMTARLNRTRFSRFKRSLEAFGLIDRLPLTNVRKHADGFQPEVVLSVMERRNFTDLACRFSRERNIPLVLIVHDFVEDFEPVYSWAATAQRKRYAEIYKSAHSRLCISPVLRDRLEQLYGAAGTVLYPIRSESITPRRAADSLELKHPPFLTLGYAGSLSYGYGEQISILARLLSKARAKLHIYSRDTAPEKLDGVEYMGRDTPEHTWEKLKRDCDATLLVYSWSNDWRQLSETHFPSKLPEYLALGMPLLIVGPAYAAGVRWGLRNPEAAITVTDQSEASFMAACSLLRESAAKRQELAANALVSGEKDFTPSRLRKIFYDSLFSAARK